MIREVWGQKYQLMLYKPNFDGEFTAFTELKISCWGKNILN